MFKGKRTYCLSTWLHVWLSSENGKNGSIQICGEDRVRDLFFFTAPMVSFVRFPFLRLLSNDLLVLDFFRFFFAFVSPSSLMF